jgi:hypothetical protein
MTIRSVKTARCQRHGGAAEVRPENGAGPEQEGRPSRARAIADLSAACRASPRVDDSRRHDTIACTAVNDIFVLTQFAKDTGAQGKILMLADGNGEFAKKIGLDIDLSGLGLGLRSKRYAMRVDDGVVKILNVEDAPPQHDKSSAATLCSMIDRSL